MLMKTTPLGDDLLGQLSGGVLVLKGMLFTVLDLKALTEIDKDDYLDNWAFSLDDCGDEYHTNNTYFVSLAESPDAWRVKRLRICGILVQDAKQNQTTETVFQRVGFAIVAPDDGDIAGTGIKLDNWVVPPWREDQLQVITIK